MCIRRLKLLYISVIVIFILGGCGLPSIRIMPEVENFGGKIVIVREVLRKEDIYSSLYLLRSDLLQQIPNTEMAGEILYPHWSPDGKKIAFYADNGRTLEEVKKNNGVYLVDEDGNNLKRIKDGGIWPFDLTSQGNQIIFQLFSLRQGMEKGFYIFNLDGTGLRKLNAEEEEQYSKSTRWPDTYNRYSPDGKKKITYKSASEIVSCNEIYVTYIDTGVTEKITKKNFFQFSNNDGVWSSDSKKIMYLWTSVLERQAIRLYDLESKKTVNILIRPGGRDIEGFDWWTPPVK